MKLTGFWNLAYMTQRSCHIWLAIVVTGCLALGSSNAFSELNTNQIKSAYLYQISKFVFWPENRKQTDFFNLCLLGPDTYGGNLQKMEGRTVFAKPVKLKHVANLEQAATCHLLLLTAPKSVDFPALTAWLKNHSVLTVVDGEQYADKAMVAFVIESQRVRLHINVDLANRSGVSFAANLLEVASKVTTGGQL